MRSVHMKERSNHNDMSVKLQEKFWNGITEGKVNAVNTKNYVVAFQREFSKAGRRKRDPIAIE